MTNTHITVGGHKITTNKVGQVHNITPASGFSVSSGGWLQYCVTNGICIVSMYTVMPTSTGNAQLLATNLPKPKMGGFVDCYNNRGGIYIKAGETNLYCNVLVANNLNAVLTYPVADDWVES